MWTKLQLFIAQVAASSESKVDKTGSIFKGTSGFRKTSLEFRQQHLARVAAKRAAAYKYNKMISEPLA